MVHDSDVFARCITVSDKGSLTGQKKKNEKVTTTKCQVFMFRLLIVTDTDSLLCVTQSFLLMVEDTDCMTSLKDVYVRTNSISLNAVNRIALNN